MESFILAMMFEMMAAFILTSITFIKLINDTINDTRNDIEQTRLDKINVVEG
jgi:hypothetical protein